MIRPSKWNPAIPGSWAVGIILTFLVAAGLYTVFAEIFAAYPK